MENKITGLETTITNLQAQVYQLRNTNTQGPKTTMETTPTHTPPTGRSPNRQPTTWEKTLKPPQTKPTPAKPPHSQKPLIEGLKSPSSKSRRKPTRNQNPPQHSSANPPSPTRALHNNGLQPSKKNHERENPLYDQPKTLRPLQIHDGKTCQQKYNHPPNPD